MSQARLYDRGYHHYDGPRTAPSTAVGTLRRHTFAALLGRRRKWTAKLLPVVVGGVAYGPALVFAAIASIIPAQITDAFLPGPQDYLVFTRLAVLLFAIIGAPQALCPDRRSGLLAMYLASPLDRDRYLVAKAAAVGMFLAIVTIGPSLVLIIALALVDAGPIGIDGYATAILRAVVAGVGFGALYGAISMAVSSITDRWTAAAAGVALWILASNILVRAILLEVLKLPGEVELLNVGSVAASLTAVVYGEPVPMAGVGAFSVVAAAVVWVVVAAAFTRWRYQRLAVTR